ncbi:uncharacterized protein CCOS01_06775 [Colletotrichum costaricense]|uniref:Uncharacterized protein n=1 Tax=Colletotrichum costaricense TaxID=1209916 RepID=A0AAJ0E179_9PEZI|nr:uncharacterized protein CCOS01_06775 [Colletotrichum costaricense]KAK1528941.1 hypothetical protein CCOS01_06775 [Colletotrichum costaricense]
MSGIQYPTSGWTIEFEVQPWRQRLLHFHAPVVYLPLFLCTSHPLSESESPSPSPGPRQSEAIAKPNGHFSRSQSPPQPCKVPSRLTPSLGSRVDHDHAPASQACTRGGPGGGTNTSEPSPRRTIPQTGPVFKETLRIIPAMRHSRRRCLSARTAAKPVTVRAILTTSVRSHGSQL